MVPPAFRTVRITLLTRFAMCDRRADQAALSSVCSGTHFLLTFFWWLCPRHVLHVLQVPPQSSTSPTGSLTTPSPLNDVPEKDKKQPRSKVQLAHGLPVRTPRERDVPPIHLCGLGRRRWRVRDLFFWWLNSRHCPSAAWCHRCTMR